jgi:hypothetical protein
LFARKLLRVDAALSRRAWRGLVVLPEAQTLVWHLLRPSHAHDVHGAAAVLLYGPLQPLNVVPLLERLVERRVLTREEASTIEERLLEHTGKEGVWR